MFNVIVIHEKGLSPDSAWYPWLKKELEKREGTVHFPTFSDDDYTGDWRSKIKEFLKFMDSDSMIIGHGEGVKIALKILETKSRTIASTFLVAGHLDDEQFDFENIKTKSDEFFVYASDNDSQVPAAKTEHLASMVGETSLIIADAKHFDEMTDFEDILIDIISVINQ
jgi:predicted alpha/beta hydrolase family esterase